MTVAELRKLIEHLDDETRIWFRAHGDGVATTFFAESATLLPATSKLPPALVLSNNID